MKALEFYLIPNDPVYSPIHSWLLQKNRFATISVPCVLDFKLSSTFLNRPGSSSELHSHTKEPGMSTTVQVTVDVTSSDGSCLYWRKWKPRGARSLSHFFDVSCLLKILVLQKYIADQRFQEILYLAFKRYRMVFASICEHASRAFIFARTSSNQFSHASSEHFVNFPPAGISLY